MPSKAKSVTGNSHKRLSPQVSAESLTQTFIARIFRLPPSPEMWQLVEGHVVGITKALAAGEIVEALALAYGVGNVCGAAKQMASDFRNYGNDVCRERNRKFRQQVNVDEGKAESWSRVRLASELFADSPLPT